MNKFNEMKSPIYHCHFQLLLLLFNLLLCLCLYCLLIVYYLPLYLYYYIFNQSFSISSNHVCRSICMYVHICLKGVRNVEKL